MLKRIKPEHVRLGMFIEAVEGTWTDQPFWHSRLLLERPKDVQALKVSGVNAVIINTEKGADAIVADASNKTATRHQDAHLKRALRTIEHSRTLIKEMFDDARMGGAVSVANATQAVMHISTCMKDNSRALIEITRLKTKDEHTFLHSVAVTALMVHLGRSIHLDERAALDLGMGGMLHDIGKMKLSLDILNKAGPLDAHEMGLVRNHPLDG
ncbi:MULTISPECIES: HD-GYP domain-containing protein [unclassified Rhizobium]|uniref:HD-GYP domain-containing protein n=1 Tax=unclassified Rhizobium TaxID=2613769 RepID=UPI001AD96852|nr:MULTISPECIES: HD-GYP domain-containing protein [unclassified Rhizobium]MBO9101881.1 DUF3391 domain-containing protein [Rhizobium sp. L58/93]MBO9172052.1 DUF3391 domain-containing protein [Rhizobium sp. L245/93]QXZ88275.1 DUF3391 domain-containing protein [Rhizobium sp. K1/93]QXZ94246.1 DUF3391 domain-containing protein [Rhizobium sp. K15/93]QYA05664.1 DUF3391 domain-containing protein [Rhizobium sp. B21/90]